MTTTNTAAEIVDEERRREFVEVARDFAQREIAPYAAEWDREKKYHVAPTKKRMQNLIAAHQANTKGQVHPNIFLFMDRRSLLQSSDVFSLPWTNGNGKRVALCP